MTKGPTTPTKQSRTHIYGIELISHEVETLFLDLVMRCENVLGVEDEIF